MRPNLSPVCETRPMLSHISQIIFSFIYGSCVSNVFECKRPESFKDQCADKWCYCVLKERTDSEPPETSRYKVFGNT